MAAGNEEIGNEEDIDLFPVWKRTTSKQFPANHALLSLPIRARSQRGKGKEGEQTRTSTFCGQLPSLRGKGLRAMSALRAATAAVIVGLALLLHAPTLRCNADVYIPEHPCAGHQGQTCVQIRGGVVCK